MRAWARGAASSTTSVMYRSVPVRPNDGTGPLPGLATPRRRAPRAVTPRRHITRTDDGTMNTEETAPNRWTKLYSSVTVHRQAGTRMRAGASKRVIQSTTGAEEGSGTHIM